RSTTRGELLNGVSHFAAQRLKSVGIYVAALTALVLALTKLRKSVEDLVPDSWQWLWLAVAGLPFGATLVGHTIPIWLAQRRRRRLDALALSGSPTLPGYFRVTPYGSGEEDRARYTRADQAQQRVLEWLGQTAEPVLFLTGVSGAGKSSLLNAYVLPKLQEAQSVQWILVRSFHDPVADLERELMRPGVVWERPPPNMSNPRSLLERVSERLGRTVLFMVFDQFEEFLIIHERDEQRLKALESLFASLRQNPLSNVKVLLVLRSDYLGMLQAFERRDALPPLRQEVNWMEISAFREREAREFLENSGLQIGPRLMDEIFRQIAEIEETNGLVRPITLNMVGLVL